MPIDFGSAAHPVSAHPSAAPLDAKEAGRAAASNGLAAALFNAMMWVVWLVLFAAVAYKGLSVVSTALCAAGLAIWVGIDVVFVRRLIRIVRAPEIRPG